MTQITECWEGHNHSAALTANIILCYWISLDSYTYMVIFHIFFKFILFHGQINASLSSWTTQYVHISSPWISKGVSATSQGDIYTLSYLKRQLSLQWISPAKKTLYIVCSQQKQHTCITFAQRRPNVFDAGPTLYKCYTNVLCTYWVLTLSPLHCYARL